MPKQKQPETLQSKVYRLLADGKTLSSPQNARIVGAFDNGLTTFLVVLSQQDNGFVLEFEKPFSMNVCDKQGITY